MHPPHDTSSASPRHILHVEDNPVDAELVRALIEEQWPGCRITRVQARDTFLRALREDTYDLILSDFSLPQFDGLSALDLAIQENSAIPFIFLSGTIGEENAVEALRRGAIDYVIKDRPARLIPAIRRALGEKHEQRRRREAERRLIEQAELLDKAHDAIVVSDLDRRVIYWNQGATRLFGWTAAEALGQRGVDLFGELALDGIKQTRPSADDREWLSEVKVRSKDGKELIVESSVTVIRDDAGQPKSHLIISTDITEKKRIETQFLRTQRLESIGTLAGGIAHDLNNVLAPILMAVNIIQQKVADPEVQRLMDILETSANHGAGLVRQVLAFARGAEGARANLRPKLAIREVVTLLSETLPRSISVDMDIAPDVALIHADSTQLGQILMNLCVNARDAMPNGGRLLIRALNVVVGDSLARGNPGAKPGPHVLITVEDSGTGIPPEIIDRIFDPFFTTKAPGKGTGLGLATSLGIVKDHGGFIQVQSESGRGTIFSLYFPAVQQPATNEPREPAANLTPGRGQTILVIDDEAGICEMARAFLEAFGYRALTTTDALHGIALFMQQRANISVVIVDLMMPAMQGSEVIRQLREIEPDVSIVIMSGLADERTRSAAESPQLTFLQKPMTGGEMLHAIKRVMPQR